MVDLLKHRITYHNALCYFGYQINLKYLLGYGSPHFCFMDVVGPRMYNEGLVMVVVVVVSVPHRSEKVEVHVIMMCYIHKCKGLGEHKSILISQ